MPTLTAATLRTQLQAGSAGPLYLLLGEDDAEKAVENQVSAAQTDGEVDLRGDEKRGG